MKLIKRLAKVLLKNTKYKLINRIDYHERKDIREDAGFQKIYRLCRPYTMTSIERMYSLYKSVEYVIQNKIPGDFVECGVWKGGSTMLIATYLQEHKLTDRKIFLYDTFEGMPQPKAEDVDVSGVAAQQKFDQLATGTDSSDWCYASLEEVRTNMQKTGFPDQQTVYVKGKVEETIPGTIPDDDIALLRLDTDWHDSTKHELIHLYPKIPLNGVLILDDFGHWEGAKKAVLDYFKENDICMLLNRIDYCGRIGIKTMA